MTSWRYSVAALTIFVGACDVYLDVTIQTPTVEVVAAEATFSGDQGSVGSPINQTRELRLPICDLMRCASGDCAEELSNQLSASTSETWRLLDGRPTEVRQFVPNGYFLTISTSASDGEISESWASLACIRGDLSAEGPLASRTRQCFRHMSSWVLASIADPVEILSSEPRYRATCRRMS